MSYVHRLSPSSVGVTLTPEKFASRLASFLSAQGITTEAQMSAYLDGLDTVAKLRAALKEMVLSLVDIVPPP